LFSFATVKVQVCLFIYAIVGLRKWGAIAVDKEDKKGRRQEEVGVPVAIGATGELMVGF
jgi:hypothetical protein